MNIIARLDSVNRDSDRHQGLHPQEELEQSLRRALLDLGVDDTHRSDDHGTRPEPAMSERLRLLADALTNRFNEGVSRPWIVIFSSGYRNPFNFIRDVSNGNCQWHGESGGYDFFDDSDPKTLTQTIRSRMLAGAIEALASVGTDEAIGLIGELLSEDCMENALRFIETTSYTEYYGIRNDLQLFLLRVLSELSTSDIQDYVIDFINCQEWVVDDKSAYLSGTSFKALKTATSMVSRENLHRIRDRIRSFNEVGSIDSEVADFVARTLEEIDSAS